jgi:3-dehydroquinate dehydratase II
MADLLDVIRSGRQRWRIGMINGPNMVHLERRERDRFGSVGSITDLESRVAAIAEGLGVELARSVVSNHEGEILDWIQTQTDDLDGLLVNPAGLTWTGEATRHALFDTGLPVIEVHFANPARRGKPSIFSDSVAGTCMGLRKHSYAAALVALVAMLDDGDFQKPALFDERMSRLQRAGL